MQVVDWWFIVRAFLRYHKLLSISMPWIIFSSWYINMKHPQNTYSTISPILFTISEIMCHAVCKVILDSAL